MKRRDLMRMAPAMVAVGALPASAQQAVDRTDTPVIRAYREWKAYRNWLENDTRGMPDDEFARLMDQRHDMEMAMFDVPSHDMTDVALKLSAYTDCGGDFSEDGYHTGQRLMRELVRMAEANVMVGGVA